MLRVDNRPEARQVRPARLKEGQLADVEGCKDVVGEDVERLSDHIKNEIRVLMHQRLLVAPEDIALLGEFTKQIRVLSDKLLVAQITDQVRCCCGAIIFWLADALISCDNLTAFCACNRPRATACRSLPQPAAAAAACSSLPQHGAALT
jgi:hypothetical protein